MENGKDTGLPPNKRKKPSKKIKEEARKRREQMKKQGGRKTGKLTKRKMDKK